VNSAPIRATQLRPGSGRVVSVTPSFAVPNLLGRVARFKLAQPVVDRGEGYRDALAL